MSDFFDSRDLFENESCVRLARSVIPLQRVQEGGSDLEVFASGVLLHDGGRHFILTARHAFEDFEQDAIYLSANTDEETGRNSLRADSTNIHWGYTNHEDWDLGAMYLPPEQVSFLPPFQTFATKADCDFESSVTEKTVLVFVGFPIRLNLTPPKGKMAHLPVQAIHPSHYEALQINPRSEIAGYYNFRSTIAVDGSILGGLDPTGMSGGLVLAGELLGNSLKDVNFKIKGIGSNFSVPNKTIVGINFNNPQILEGLKGITIGST